MRETRLFDYATPVEVEHFASTDIVVSSGDLQGSIRPHGTWAGLVDGATTWRVEEGSVLILEKILSRTGLRINLSSPLTCRPLLRAASSGSLDFIDVLLSCYSYRNGCTLIRIRASLADSNSVPDRSCEEVSRLQLTATYVTCMTEVDGDIVMGRADGSCAVVKFLDGPPSKIDVIPFAADPTVNTDNRNHGENTSMVSGASGESGPSHRSVASSMSFGLMTRLFGSPRGTSNTPRHAVEATSQEHSNSRSTTQRSRDDRSSYAYKRTMDKVVGVAKVQLEVKSVMSLHESGRMCVYVAKESTYQFVADIVLPVKLSTGLVNHFLLTGPSESAIAVVMVDEDPNADSLRLFNVTAKLRADRAVALSSTQIAKRDGPVDRVVSASFTGEDVIVASETGFVSGVLNVSNEVESNYGIPTGTLWTALDDMDQPFGLGRVLDDAVPDPRFQLLHAHRFSASTIAKALRLDNPSLKTRSEIEVAVKSTIFEEDGENMWKRIKVRAEQITKCEDLIVRDVSLIPDVGVIVARKRSVFVLRGLSDAEIKCIGDRAHLLRDKQPVTSFEAALMLSSHGACQILASQYSNASGDGAVDESVRFMLTMATSFSEVKTDLSLTDRIALQRASTPRGAGGEDFDFPSAVASTIATLEPGPQLLSFLHSSAEMDMLSIAADQAIAKVPISSMFANGLSVLAQFRKRSSESMADREASANLAGMGDELESADVLLNRAYASLVTATEWCRSGEVVAESDADCVMTLAGLSDRDAIGGQNPQRADGAFGAQDDVVMAVGSDRLPNGPDRRLVREHLDFWLLERAVRLLESSGAPKSAAAAALEAMSRAPDRQKHEMMRAAAFSRFLDAGELEHALTAILNQPYVDEYESGVNPEESGALRDAIGLFVNAVADRGLLQWLAHCKLPEPLHVLCGLALERRARAADPMSIQHLMSPKGIAGDSRAMMDAGDGDGGGGEAGPQVREYEQLYSWHVLRGDESSAATAALEWGERLSGEGLAMIRSVIANQTHHISIEQQIRVLLAWTRSKCEAWSYASSSAELEPIERRYIARSRFSLLADVSTERGRGLVGVSWVSRRHLLAHAQGRCLTRMLSQDESDGTKIQRIQYLLSHDSPLLGEQREGVRWVVNTLVDYPLYDNILLCAELGSAWREEIGEGVLTEVVKNAASLASQKAVISFTHSELDDLLQAILSTGGTIESSRNWNLLALESALSTSAGAVASPQWLVDAAAWGTTGFAEGTAATERTFTGRRRGDAAGVVRALLRNHRPIDAAKLLLVGLAGQERTKTSKGKGAFYVPYSAIDSTLEMLAQLATDYPSAEEYRKLLATRSNAHISKMMDRMKDSAEESMEVVGS